MNSNVMHVTKLYHGLQCYVAQLRATVKLVVSPNQKLESENQTYIYQKIRFLHKNTSSKFEGHSLKDDSKNQCRGDIELFHRFVELIRK